MDLRLRENRTAIQRADILNREWQNMYRHITTSTGKELTVSPMNETVTRKILGSHIHSNK